jgi:transposase
MKRGRPRPATTITAEQRQQLEDWTRRRTTAQALARRAWIVLLSLQGVNDVQIARRLHTTRETVGRWRRRFLSQGVDGLLDEPRPELPGRLAIKRWSGW